MALTARDKIRKIIFGFDTPAGKAFDIILLIAIVVSVITVALETIERYDLVYHTQFQVLEWMLTIFFTIEYGLRLYSSRSPWKYATSFFGVIDLLAILPTYVSLFLSAAGFETLLIIRAMRLLRVFRILKLASFTLHGRIIISALKQSRAKIGIFLFFILVSVSILGAIMYIIENPRQPTTFSDIPTSVYWAIVTLTTVGYGDITPITPLGRFISAMIMILGYAVIAVPTGIITKEIISPLDKSTNRTCRRCKQIIGDTSANYCKYCGEELAENNIQDIRT